jgi:hypothetical protein
VAVVRPISAIHQLINILTIQAVVSQRPCHRRHRRKRPFWTLTVLLLCSLPFRHRRPPKLNPLSDFIIHIHLILLLPLLINRNTRLIWLLAYSLLLQLEVILIKFGEITFFLLIHTNILSKCSHQITATGIQLAHHSIQPQHQQHHKEARIRQITHSAVLAEWA